MLRVQEDLGVQVSAYATKWYITLFANVVPFRTQLRIWDIMLLEGREVLVLIAIGIVWSLRGAHAWLSVCRSAS